MIKRFSPPLRDPIALLSACTATFHRVLASIPLHRPSPCNICGLQVLQSEEGHLLPISLSLLHSFDAQHLENRLRPRDASPLPSLRVPSFLHSGGTTLRYPYFFYLPLQRSPYAFPFLLFYTLQCVWFCLQGNARPYRGYSGHQTTASGEHGLRGEP